METDPQPASIFTQLFILLVLTLVRGYFAGAEMAVASVNKNKIHRLKEQGKSSPGRAPDGRINSVFICDPISHYTDRFFLQCCCSNRDRGNAGREDEWMGCPLR